MSNENGMGGGEEGQGKQAESSLNDILYGGPPPEKKQEAANPAISKDLAKRRQMLAAAKVKQYKDTMNANIHYEANVAKPLPGPYATAPQEPENPVIMKASSVIQTDKKSSMAMDLNRFDKGNEAAKLPAIKSSTISVEKITLEEKTKKTVMAPPPTTGKNFDEEDEKQPREAPTYGAPYSKPYEEPEQEPQPVPQPTPYTQQPPYKDPMNDKQTETTQYDKESPSYDMKPHAPETKVMSPTVAEPSYDPAKEFLMLLFSPTTPFLKRKQLMMEPLPKSIQRLECSVQRDKAGLSKKMYPKYNMVLSSNQRFLLAGQKMNMIGTAHYIVSLEQEDMTKKAAGYLGKVRSDGSGTEYNVFDQGENPSAGFPPDRIRNQLGAIYYEQTASGNKGPRKMNVLVPRINEDGSQVVWKPMKESDHMIPRYKIGNRSEMLCLINKPPTWNVALEAYVLNFSGRVTMPSVKNFQLIDPNEDNVIIMQFGRVDEHLFNLDISYPLSFFQAFSIAISSFNYSYQVMKVMQHISIENQFHTQ